MPKTFKDVLIQLLKKFTHNTPSMSPGLKYEFQKSINFLQNEAVIEDTPENRQEVLDFVRNEVFFPYQNELNNPANLYALNQFYNLVVNKTTPKPSSGFKSR